MGKMTAKWIDWFRGKPPAETMVSLTFKHKEFLYIFPSTKDFFNVYNLMECKSLTTRCMTS